MLRRDLTINAIAQDEKGDLIDPYNGIKDLENKTLRKVSGAFAEDPLRVLRVARFASKLKFLDFKIEEETLDLMKSIVVSGEIRTLSKERIWMETYKALKTKSPEIFFSVLQDVGALNEICTLKIMNLKALESASLNIKDTAIRWAILISGNTNMKEINTAFNLPKEIIEVSSVCESLVKFKETQPSAQSILEIIHHNDLLRKPKRFFRALEASVFFNNSEKVMKINWNEIYDIVNNVHAETSLKDGKLIAKKLQEDRLQVLEKYLQ